MLSDPERNAPRFADGLLRWSVLAWALVVLPHFLTDTPYYPVRLIIWGNDLRFFYDAATYFSGGFSPYLRDWFFSPPTAALLVTTLTLLPFGLAYFVFSLGSMGAMVWGLWLSAKSALDPAGDGPARAGGEARRVFFSSVGILLLGLPLQFLMVRGNLDGIILFLTIAALALLNRAEWFSGILIAIGAALKIYSGLLFLPLFFAGRRTAVLVGALTFVALGANVSPCWVPFFHRLASRDAIFMLDENVSFPAFFSSVAAAVAGCPGIDLTWPKRAGLLAFVVLLAIRLIRDRARARSIRENPLPWLSLYFPLCVSIPSIVHNYELVFLVPLVPVLARCYAHAANRRERIEVGWVGGALALSQIHSVAAIGLSGALEIALLPQFGLFAVAVACATGRLDPMLERSFSRRGPDAAT
jgi:hypothetical protein